MVDYVCEKGRQDVWSKKWREPAGKAERIEYAESLPKPAKKTPGQARELEKRLLTSRRESGIIKNIEIPAETNEIRSMSDETKKLVEQAIEKLNSEYDIKIDEFVTEPLKDEDKNVPFQFQPKRGENGELIKRLVINSKYDFMGSQEEFQKRIMRNYNKKVLAANSVEGLLAHEMAHIMTFQDTYTFSGYLLENKKVSKRIVYGISKYADVSNDGAECIAEAFAAKRCGATLSKEAQDLLDEFIERWHR